MSLWMCVHVCEQVWRLEVSFLSFSVTFWGRMLSWQINWPSSPSDPPVFIVPLLWIHAHITAPEYYLFPLFIPCFEAKVRFSCLHSKQWLSHLPNPFQRELGSSTIKISGKLCGRVNVIWTRASHRVVELWAFFGFFTSLKPLTAHQLKCPGDLGSDIKPEHTCLLKLLKHKYELISSTLNWNVAVCDGAEITI